MRAVLKHTDLGVLLVRALGDALDGKDVSASRHALKAMDALGMSLDKTLKERVDGVTDALGNEWAIVREAASKLQ